MVTRLLLPPGQRCQALEHQPVRCPHCGGDMGTLVRCTQPAQYKVLDWWTCALHRDRGVLDAALIGVTP
jgi:hypothetical protein